jgi:hypothetical protein
MASHTFAIYEYLPAFYWFGMVIDCLISTLTDELTHNRDAGDIVSERGAIHISSNDWGER